MCGIFGFVGSSTTAPKKVFQGLSDIEYRGYDSWGIVFLENEKLKTIKDTGFLPKKLTLPESHIALGHTRWATHGGVTVANTHPHSDCLGQISLVHNGIVENYTTLKESVKDHDFKSETDTEVVVHLIEENLKTRLNLAQSAANVFKSLQGLNAIVVTNGKEIVACRRGSPLVIGKGKNFFVVASDPNAVLPYTSNLFFMEDDQMVVMGEKLEVVDLSSEKQIRPRFTQVSWEHDQSSLFKHKHFLEKEISEQPKVLRAIVENSHELEKVSNLVKKSYGTFLIACGSASYSCLLGTYLFSKIAKRHINFAVGSEFNYIQDYLTDKSLLIAVSQSGESIDVLEPVQSAKKRGTKIVGLVNVLGSSLYRVSDYPVLLQAGPEKAVCSTKALTAMFANMILLSYCLIGKRKQAENILLDSASEILSILKRKEEIEKLADKLYKCGHIFILGRGLSYPIALESALKIVENSYIHAQGFAAGELKHGVIALIDKETPVIVFAPNDETREAVLANAMEVKARGAYVIGVGFKNDPVFDFFFEVKDTGASSVIAHTVFAQLLSYYLALKLGRNPDKPRNLAKSVTVR